MASCASPSDQITLVNETLLIPASAAGAMCARSEASWWRDNAAHRVPSPVRLGGRTLWRVQELREWVAAGCPDRAAWQAMKTSTARK
jgi:predicted DNA-binding transcriptional regulator AlpA